MIMCDREREERDQHNLGKAVVKGVLTRSQKKKTQGETQLCLDFTLRKQPQVAGEVRGLGTQVREGEGSSRRMKERKRIRA